jgi:hypothetical protein
MKRALLVLLLSAAPALAQTPTLAPTPAGSNIGLAQYPAPGCTRPQPVDAQKPAPLPENYTDDQAKVYNRRVDAFNAQMRAYNAQMATYGGCIQTYVANGNADMRRIRDALDAAVATANR